MKSIRPFGSLNDADYNQIVLQHFKPYHEKKQKLQTFSMHRQFARIFMER